MNGRIFLICTECDAVGYDLAENQEAAILLNFLENQSEQPPEEKRWQLGVSLVHLTHRRREDLRD